MIVLKVIWKLVRVLVLLPIYAILKIIEWMCNLAQLLSGWVFRLLGLLMLATAVACWVMRLDTAPEIIRMLVAGVTVFLLPMVGDFIVAGIMLVEFPIKQAIKN